MKIETLERYFKPEGRWAISTLFRNGKLEDCVIGKLLYIYSEETHGNDVKDVYFDYILFGYSVQDEKILIKNKQGNHTDQEADEEMYWSIDEKYLYNNKKVAEKEFVKFLIQGKNTE